MNKIGLVILNFLTYEDTLESIKTLDKTLVKNVDLKIYVVDNKSDSNKFKELQENIQDMNSEFDITYIASSENLGFAKGMNIGIDKARENGCNFVICSNNDIIYNQLIDFNKFIEIFNKDNSIAIIGPKILSPDGINQNPYMLKNQEKSSLIKFIKHKLIFSNIIGKLVFFIFGYKNYFFRNKIKNVNTELIPSQYIYALHGSFMIFTPSYFKFYNNLDPNTFLYNEELILAERVLQKNLKIFYTNEVTVFHKDDSSTNKMLGKNSFKKLNFVFRENYKSRSYFLKEYIWNKK
jgi:GT2 family glycosyltransferase